MAALTDNKEVPAKEGKLVSMKVKGSTHIYQGAILIIGADGYVKPAVAEANAFLAGIAYEEVDNSAGSDGDKEVRVIRNENHLLNGSGLAITDMGSSVYASDDQTVSTTQGANEVKVGQIVEVVSATEIYVDITK